MAQDPRTARSLLKLCREFAEFDEVEVSAGATTVRVRRRSAAAQSSAEPVKAKASAEPVKRSAVESLRDNPPPFWNS